MLLNRGLTVFSNSLFEFILELSVKFASQICNENTNTPLDVTYLADFGTDIILELVSIFGDKAQFFFIIPIHLDSHNVVVRRREI